MTTETMTATAAKVELMLLNGETHDLDWADIVTLLHARGAKLELVTRMQELCRHSAPLSMIFTIFILMNHIST